MLIYQECWGNVQPVWWELQLQPCHDPEEEDCHQHHHQPARERRGKPQLSGVFLLPLSSVRVSHEQTQDCHREGECESTGQGFVSLSMTKCSMVSSLFIIRIFNCIIKIEAYIGQNVTKKAKGLTRLILIDLEIIFIITSFFSKFASNAAVLL